MAPRKLRFTRKATQGQHWKKNKKLFSLTPPAFHWNQNYKKWVHRKYNIYLDFFLSKKNKNIFNR